MLTLFTYTVDTVDMAHTVNMIYTVDMGLRGLRG